MARFRRVLIPLYLVLCLAACSQSTGPEYLDNYLGRLENVLGIELNAGLIKNGEQLSHYPFGFSGSGAGLTSSQSISILQFLSLYGCDLQMVVAEGNNSLGKFAPTSQVLIRHLKFLHFAPRCVEMLDPASDTELIEQLQSEQEHKRKALPHLVWQALLNEDEARRFWDQPASLGDYPKQVGIDPELAIRRLAVLAEQWLSGEYIEGLNELESLLSDVRIGDGGSLVMAYALLRQKLHQANEMLDRYIERESCQNNRAEIDVRVLENVVQKYFVGEVQVWAADLNRRVYSLVDGYQKLEDQLKQFESPEYMSWREDRNRFFQGGIKSMGDHVRKLQQAMDKCRSSS